jgi:hypothetical protein
VPEANANDRVRIGKYHPFASEQSCPHATTKNHHYEVREKKTLWVRIAGRQVTRPVSLFFHPREGVCTERVGFVVDALLGKALCQVGRGAETQITIAAAMTAMSGATVKVVCQDAFNQVSATVVT